MRWEKVDTFKFNSFSYKSGDSIRENNSKANNLYLLFFLNAVTLQPVCVAFNAARQMFDCSVTLSAQSA